MSVVSVEARSFILALFIRDDGERFLLGDNGYDFIDSQLHFTANAIENDEVQKQGTDGVLVAGQVRRASVQTFDGYIGDATTPKSRIEQMRRDFFAFFAKGHHFRVIYVDCNRDAWQRKGGYLVDAPEVKELWQIHPEYHVGLNFEDVNYYEYDENAEGEEILANVLSVPISSEIEGGLEWDGDGAISVLPYGSAKTATGNPISIADAVEAPLKSLEIQGETSQQTYTGKNLLKLPSAGTNDGVTYSVNSDGTFNVHGTNNSGYEILFSLYLDSSEFQSVNYTLGAREALPYGLGCRCEIYMGGTWKRSFVSVNYTRQTQTGTPDFTDANRVRVAITVANGATVNIDNVGIQLEKGSSPTTFEPYVGGIPAPNPDYPQAVQTVTGENVVKISDGQGNEQSYTVDLASKNLFDATNANTRTGYILNNSGVEVSDNTGGYTRNYSRVLPSTTYTISGLINAGTRRVYYYDQNKNFISRSDGSGASSWQFITPANCYFVNVQIYTNTDNSTSMASWQIEKGSSASQFEPYWAYELCKIGDYQDYIYKDGSDWKIHKEVGKYVYNNDLTGNGISSTLVAMLTPALSIAPNLSTLDGVAVSNMYGTISTEITKLGGTTSISCIRVNTSIDIADSYNAVKALAAANNLTIYYALATPTDTIITNSALIEQLEAILAGGTQAGANTITLTPSAGATGTLEVEYYSEYQDGGYVWEEGGSGGPTTVVNESISAVYPVWTVYGPAQNPILENTTNNTSIEYVGMVADGQTLVIDMGAQTASLDGLNVLSALTGDFIQLEAGSNILLYSASNDAPASEIGWSEIVG